MGKRTIICKQLKAIADELDAHGQFEYADEITKSINRIAQTVGPAPSVARQPAQPNATLATMPDQQQMPQDVGQWAMNQLFGSKGLNNPLLKGLGGLFKRRRKKTKPKVQQATESNVGMAVTPGQKINPANAIIPMNPTVTQSTQGQVFDHYLKKSQDPNTNILQFDQYVDNEVRNNRLTQQQAQQLKTMIRNSRLQNYGPAQFATGYTPPQPAPVLTQPNQPIA